MSTPLVSVIIPVYNRATIISRTLDSLVELEHHNWECILVDDASTDNSVEIMKTYASKDQRFKLTKRPSHRPKGANACRNIGLEMSQGDYINFLDSDDTLHPEKFTLQIEAIHNTPYQFSVCQTMVIDDATGEELGLRSSLVRSTQPLDDYITFNSFWTVHPPLYKTSFINKYRFDESLQQSQEYELTIRILKDKPTFHTTELVLAYLHFHSQRMSSSVTNQPSKIISNLEVRLRCFKMLGDELLPQTQDHLYEYLFEYYRKLILLKEWSKAWMVYKYMERCSRYYFRLKRKRIKYLARWILAIPSYYLSNKGVRFLRYIEYSR